MRPAHVAESTAHLHRNTHTSRSKPGPASQLERRFEQIKLLPRKRQQFILQFLDAMISVEKA